MKGKAVIIIAYFGKWPEWFDLFLLTCSYNPTWNWLLFTDCGVPENAPSNVTFHEFSFQELQHHFSEKLGRTLQISRPYKLCDYKLAYGKIFEDYTGGYEYFGFGDIDVFYGNLDSFVDPLKLRSDIITCHRAYLSGHFTLMKNDQRLKCLFYEIPGIFEKLSDKEIFVLDELLFKDEVGWSVHQVLFPQEERFEIFRSEFYTTPYAVIPWVDGKRKFPVRWRWQDGRIFALDEGKTELPYLHCMKMAKPSIYSRLNFLPNWGQLARIVQGDTQDLRKGFVVTHAGIFPANAHRYSAIYRDGFVLVHIRMMYFAMRLRVGHYKRKVMKFMSSLFR